jgi:hypothetical protein
MHTSLVDYNLASGRCKNGAPYSHIYCPSLICMHWFIGLFMFPRLCILCVDFDWLTFPTQTLRIKTLIYKDIIEQREYRLKTCEQG